MSAVAIKIPSSTQQERNCYGVKTPYFAATSMKRLEFSFKSSLRLNKITTCCTSKIVLQWLAHLHLCLFLSQKAAAFTVSNPT
jgi:hypothetical protein